MDSVALDRLLHVLTALLHFGKKIRNYKIRRLIFHPKLLYKQRIQLGDDSLLFVRGPGRLSSDLQLLVPSGRTLTYYFDCNGCPVLGIPESTFKIFFLSM